MTTTLTFQPLIPPSLWALLVLASGAALLSYATRRPGSVPRRRWVSIVGLMGIGMALVLLILLNPYRREPVAPPGGKPLLTVLVDASASMATADLEGQTTRFDAARDLAAQCANDLRDRFDVRLVTFSDRASPADADVLARIRPAGMTTDLARAILGGIEEVRPQGQAVLLLSDGIPNAEGQSARVFEAVRLARGVDAPIFTRTLGGEAEVRDLALELARPQDLAFINQDASVEVRLRRRGLGVTKAEVTLSTGGKDVERKTATFGAEGIASVRFDVRQDARGLYLYEARVEPIAGDASAGNNAGTFLLRVVDEPIRVLLLEGKPYWDAKFLTRTLATDPSVELESLVRLTEGRYLRRKLGRAAGAAPGGIGRVEEWKIVGTPGEILAGPEGLVRFQVVVLGRDADVFLNDATLAAIRPWLSKGGGALVCYRGAPEARISQPLASLLPVRWLPARESRFGVKLTEPGRDLRWLPERDGRSQDDLLARLPTLARDEQPGEPRPLAVVLATSTAEPGGETSPVVTYQPYGSGRVVVIEGAGMWRWAFLPPQARGQEQEAIYGSFWRSLMRWLTSGAALPPGQDLALRADKVSFRGNEPATATLLLRQDVARRAVPSIELTGGGLAGVRTFAPSASGDEPGTFRVLFGALPEGHYQARVAGRDDSSLAAFDVRNVVEEQLDLAARPDLMGRLAAESGAVPLNGNSPSELADLFRAHQARGRTEQIRRDPAWDRWWVLAGVVLVWGSAWRLRRVSGLV